MWASPRPGRGTATLWGTTTHRSTDAYVGAAAAKPFRFSGTSSSGTTSVPSTNALPRSAVSGTSSTGSTRPGPRHLAEGASRGSRAGHRHSTKISQDYRDPSTPEPCGVALAEPGPCDPPCRAHAAHPNHTYGFDNARSARRLTDVVSPGRSPRKDLCHDDHNYASRCLRR